jgi:hypothetical protein
MTGIAIAHALWIIVSLKLLGIFTWIQRRIFSKKHTTHHDDVCVHEHEHDHTKENQ